MPPAVMEEIRQWVNFPWAVLNPEAWRDNGEALQEADVIFSTWGMPKLNADFLAGAPALKAVFYAAGSVKSFVTDAGWDRGIVVSSAWVANGVPVAEYTVAAIILSLKRFWHFSRLTRSENIHSGDIPVPGAFRTKVGLVSLGAIGRATARLLRSYDVTILAYDPFLSGDQVAGLNVRLVPLEEIFRECDVVSLHVPWIPETEGIITGKLIASMKNGATLINTSRGAVVKEAEMIAVLSSRPDLSAVLDVTYPEPPTMDSPLRFLPNVILTPHIAGSIQGECARMGSWMADELRRYVYCEPLRYAVTREMADRMA